MIADITFNCIELALCASHHLPLSIRQANILTYNSTEKRSNARRGPAYVGVIAMG
jgi:hypothetical protein